MDPFAVLGLPPTFRLDVAEAEKRHLELSRTLHPDRHVQATPAERRAALSRAIEVNEAWRAVRDPIKRAEAILRAKGFGDRIGETREPKPSGDFLMEVLEARERLDEAKAARDAAAIEAVVGEAKEQLARAIDALASALDADPVSAIPLLGRLRYAARFHEEAARASDELRGL